jgi:ABC-2 type transport system ATP-binding protein
MKTVIETESLGKRYSEIQAVEGLSLRVSEGEIYAFLGLNGAGKTTTIRMLLGMIRPTSGSATVLGTRVRPGCVEPWASVGYMVEVPHAYGELTVRENLEAARRLHPGTPPEAVDKIIGQLGLAAYSSRRTSTLSHGNHQRLGLAKALLHDPALIILDEPANGLDPAGIVEIRELLSDLTANHGKTVFMSSHILAEVARLAHRVGIIHQGRLLRGMNTTELERERRKRLLVRCGEPEVARGILAAAGYEATILTDRSLELKSDPAIEHPEQINLLLVNAGVPPSGLVVEVEGLEEYFLRLVGAEAEKMGG